jgi:hypothetical protein
MFEHLIGKLFKKSERAHADQFHASGKSIKAISAHPLEKFRTPISAWNF